jgi:tRNA-dihydrouridine synthase B
MCESAGADAITVHGRTRAQQYEGKADWDAIAAVRQAVSIPVIANGDVEKPEDVPRILAHTGAAFVMIGRGSLGDPWIFERANALLETGQLPPLPPFAVRIQTAVEQIRRAAEYKGEHIAMLEARKHVSWYLKGMPSMREYKKRVSALSRFSELEALAQELCRIEDPPQMGCGTKNHEG